MKLVVAIAVAAALAVSATPAATGTATATRTGTGTGTGTATPTQQTLSGACSFSGPITPNPPITLVPKPGAHFSYAGKGTCNGTFNGTAAHALPITLTFTNVETAFDTCELGPDFNLAGTLSVPGTSSHADFPITINLARLALFGPFNVTNPGGGKATGTAQFEPTNGAEAITQCGAGGIATATLAGMFTTSAPLVGSLITPPMAPSKPATTPKTKTKSKVKGKKTRKRHRHR